MLLALALIPDEKCGQSVQTPDAKVKVQMRLENPLLLASLGVLLAAASCTLITDVDRSKIPDGQAGEASGGTGTTPPQGGEGNVAAGGTTPSNGGDGGTPSVGGAGAGAGPVDGGGAGAGGAGGTPSTDGGAGGTPGTDGGAGGTPGTDGGNGGAG